MLAVDPQGWSHPACGGCWAGGWRRQREGSGALRETSVDLEIAKNLACRRAGGQHARLAAEGSAAPLQNGAAFPRPGRERQLRLPWECCGHFGLTALYGWDAHRWLSKRQGFGFAPLGSVCSHPALGQCRSLAGELGEQTHGGWSNAARWQLLVTRHINRQECANIQRSELSRAKGAQWLQPCERSRQRQDPHVPLWAERDGGRGSPPLGARWICTPWQTEGITPWPH